MRKEAPTTTTKSSKIRCPAEVAKNTTSPNSSYLCAPELRPEGHLWVSQAQLELKQAQPRALPVGWQWFEVPAAEVKHRSSISSHSQLKAVIFKKHHFFLLAGKRKSSSSFTAKQAHKDDLG